MPHPDSSSFSTDSFDEIEAEFRARPEYATAEAEPLLITMPDEITFQKMAAEREAREAAEQERRTLATKEWLEKQKREKRVSRLKKAMAVTAAVLSVKSGGLVDMVGDQFSDAGHVVTDAVKEPVMSDYLPDRMDGIDFEDYSEDAQDEMRAEAQESMERDGQARDTVIELFEAADQRGYDGLIAEVAEQRAAHPELYIGGEKIREVIESIEDSNSNQDTLKTLGDFLDYYGMKAGFYDDREFEDRGDEVKGIARAWVDVLSVLPKDFVALTEVAQVTISDEAVSGLAGEGSEMGSYDPDHNGINIVAKSGLMGALAPVEGFLQRSDFSHQGIIAHELGHALHDRLPMPIGVYLPEDEEVDLVSPGTIAEHIGRGIINRPEAPSIYAHTSQEEYVAELLSGLLSDRSDGLASTDEWRKFGSPSNKAMIQALTRLEVQYPGIAKVLVANRA